MENENGVKKGGISVQTEHIFPVIKKWLYSEKEIFLREIVSNACDAVTKLVRLSSLGQFDAGDEKFSVRVALDKDEKTLTVSDNGIGMNAEEIEKYICQIALSGAVDFINKYESENSSGGIIGHFGLGFYSAFMVADKVEVISRSFDGSAASHFVCSENGEYEISPAEEERGRGTDVIMHLSDEGKEYLEKGKIRAILDKYCSFMPVEIYFDDGEELPTDEKQRKEAEEERAKPINETHPLWQKNPSECKDEEYIEFYHKVFGDYRDPLFWVHINADYPLNFKGILFFPPIRPEFDNLEGKVKLYYNQVYVADNIKEVIPEYLLMLRGVLDCPELPLNVSRSYLQSNSYVAKVSSHIVKKVADKLNSLFNTQREKYEGFWDNIKLFVEYGCLKDGKFFDKVKPALLLPTCGKAKLTVDEYLEGAKEKHENKLYYATDKVSQAQYVSMFEKRGITVLLMNGPVDMQFMPLIENDRKVKFLRIDAELADALKDENAKQFEDKKLEKLFRKASGIDKLTVKFENLADKNVPALLNVPEEMRRYEDMMRYYSTDDSAGMMSFAMSSATLILNGSSPLISALSSMKNRKKKALIAGQIWSLALLAQRQLTADELCSFLEMSYRTLADSAGSATSDEDDGQDEPEEEEAKPEDKVGNDQAKGSGSDE